MSKDLFHISITTEPLNPPSVKADSECGSRIEFAGVVRGSESGTPIKGIDYTAYVPMAGKILRQIGEEGKARFSEHGLWLEHRIGFVPAGEPSLYVLVTTPHSREGFEISQWYLTQIKTRVPIWKEPRIAAGASNRR